MGTTWWHYVRRIAGDSTNTQIADRAGFDKSALTRWSKGAKPDPAFVVAFARAYNANVVDALVQAELITAEEAGLKEVVLGVAEAVAAATDEQLLRELLRRIDVDGRLAHPDFTGPIDVEPLATVSPLPGYSTDDTIMPSAAYAADWQEVDSDVEAECQAQEP